MSIGSAGKFRSPPLNGCILWKKSGYITMTITYVQERKQLAKWQEKARESWLRQSLPAGRYASSFALPSLWRPRWQFNRHFAHDLAPVMARVSKQKGHMYKLLQQVYCGLKIMPREFAPVLAQDFIILLNCHPVRPSGPDTCCQSGCIRGMSTGSHRDRAWKRIPWWSTCPLRCSCWSRRRKSDGSICRALDRSTNYSVQR